MEKWFGKESGNHDTASCFLHKTCCRAAHLFSFISEVEKVQLHHWNFTQFQIKGSQLKFTQVQSKNLLGVQVTRYFFFYWSFNASLIVSFQQQGGDTKYLTRVNSEQRFWTILSPVIASLHPVIRSFLKMYLESIGYRLIVT